MKRFYFQLKDDDIGLTDDIRRIITSHECKTLCRHPNPYNMQTVEVSYSNMVDTSQKRVEVIARGAKLQCYEGTINMILGVKNMGDTYQKLLETVDE